MAHTKPSHSFLSLWWVFLRLGLTSFGGPVAHLSYFRDEFVERRRWLTDCSYSEIVALCQFLPGPASSQVGLAIGFTRGGYKGALAAWLGFTLPSAIILIIFALGLNSYERALPAGFLQGLKIVAVAVVAQAVWGMAKSLCPDNTRKILMVVAAGIVLLIPTTIVQLAVMSSFGLIGILMFKNDSRKTLKAQFVDGGRWAGVGWLCLFFFLLVFLPMWAHTSASSEVKVLDAFYRAGSLVFGGGHVVLPLLQAEVVPSGWVNNDTFLAGYGAAQAVPGPLFTFAAFLGASMNINVNGWYGALLSLFAIFLPSFLLVFGALPFWEVLRHRQKVKAALMGINAGVVGLLLAALVDPVWTSTIDQPEDFALASLAFVAITYWQIPIWVVVLSSGLITAALGVLVPSF